MDAVEEAFSAVMESLPRLPNQDLLDFGRLGELMGYDRKLNTLDFPGHAAWLPDPGPRSRACPRWSWRASCASSAAST